MATKKIQKGDTVKVIAGKDKGKTGKVVATEPKKDRVVVEGVNVVKKHQKPTQANPDGGIIQVEAPIDASNVMLLDPKVNKPTRVSIIVENGKKIRVSKKSDHKFN